jgi:hypothetical protein
MDWVDAIDRLQLQQNAVIDDQVEPMDVYRPTAISDCDGLLPLESYATV